MAGEAHHLSSVGRDRAQGHPWWLSFSFVTAGTKDLKVWLWSLLVLSDTCFGELITKSPVPYYGNPLWWARPLESYRSCFYKEDDRGLRLTVVQGLELGAVLCPQGYYAASDPGQPVMNLKHGKKGLYHPTLLLQFPEGRKDLAFSSFSSGFPLNT